jgi:hypothetical protein
MRVGRAGGPKGSRGWNYSVISGSMGAVLAMARLRRWDTETTVHALGHQLTQTAGSLQSIIDGSLAKRFQPAMMVKNVVMSAALAQAGIDGPRNVFEGKSGFINLYQDGKFDIDSMRRGLAHVRAHRRPEPEALPGLPLHACADRPGAAAARARREAAGRQAHAHPSERPGREHGGPQASTTGLRASSMRSSASRTPWLSA